MHASGQLVRPVLGFHQVVPAGVVDGGQKPSPRASGQMNQASRLAAADTVRWSALLELWVECGLAARCWRKLRGGTAPERVHEHKLDDCQNAVTAVRAINDVVL